MKRLVSGQHGFTLLEMLLAVGLLAMIGAAFMAALATATRATGTLDAEVDAAAMLRSQLAAIKNMSYNLTPTCYPDCYSASVTPVVGFSITVTTAKAANAAPTPTPYCATPVPSSMCLQKVTVTVNRSGAPYLSADMYKKQ